MQTNETLSQAGQTFEYRNHVVVDEQGVRIGSVIDVIDDDEGRAEYLVVEPGLLRSRHYVPVARSYHTNTGQVVVPWDKHWVMTGPKVPHDHVPTADIRHELDRHFTSL